MFNFTNTTTNGRPVREIRQKAKSEALEAAILTALDKAATLNAVVTESGHYNLTQEDMSKVADSVISAFFPSKDDPNREAARAYFVQKLGEQSEEDESEESDA